MKRLDRKLDGVSMTITKLKLMSSKSICDIQIIAITELKMTVEHANDEHPNKTMNIQTKMNNVYLQI